MKFQKREIGRTGKKVYPVGLGAMPMSVSGRPAHEQSLKTIQAALDAGVEFIDTADVYCIDDEDIGHNERLVAAALKEFGSWERITLATKGGLTRPDGRWERNAKPSHLRQACEKSLKVIGTDCIFLYQLHAPDPATPFEQSIDELARLQKEGKICHIGLSNVDQRQLEAALKIVRIESVQNRFNPFDQKDFKNGLISFCKTQDITYIAYSPVGGRGFRDQMSRDDQLRAIAQKYGCSTYVLALSWMLQISPNILPIPGASKPTSASDSLSAPNLSLDESDISQIFALGQT